MREAAAVIETPGGQLVGVVTRPSQPNGVGVLFPNAGVLHHVGPNRLYVRMARSLAARGYGCLRFDFSGLGDSPPRRDRLPFKAAAPQETILAMDHLRDTEGLERFVIVGLCSGADVALPVAAQDHRVIGAALVNATVRARETSGQAQEAAYREAKSRTRLRYYRRAIGSWQSLLRLVTGKSDYGKIGKTLIAMARGATGRGATSSALPVPPVVEELLSRGVELYVVFSEGSDALDLLAVTLGTDVARIETPYPNLRVEVVRDVDHVFTLLWSQDLLRANVEEWLTRRNVGPIERE